MSPSSTDTTAAMVDRLAELVKVVHNCTRTVRFNGNIQQHLVAITLHGTILELTTGCVRLLRFGDGTCVPTLLRSALEAFVDLKNVVDDPGYTDHMLAEWHYQRSRVLKSAVDRGTENPYLVDLAGNPQLELGLHQAQDELKRLSEAGRGRLKIRDRFDRAGDLDRYESVYAHLCQRSHNNLPALAERHIESDADGSAHVVYFRPIDEPTVQMYSDTFARIAASSYERVTRLVGTGGKHLESIRVALSKLEALYPATIDST